MVISKSRSLKNTFNNYCHLLGGSKPSPLGDGFSVAWRYNRPHERVSSWAPQRVRDPPAPGLGDEVSQAGASWGGRSSRAGPDPRDLRGIGCPHHKGHVSKDHVHFLVSIPPQVTISRLVQRLKGKTAYRMLRSSRRSARSSGAGTFGAGVLLLQQRQRDGRSGGGVHREPR